MQQTSFSVQLDGGRLDVSTTFSHLRIRTSTVDHKGRTSGNSLEIDNLGTKGLAHNSGPKPIESGEYWHSEGQYLPTNGRPRRHASQMTRVSDSDYSSVEAQPPSSDEFGDIRHKSPDYRPPSPAPTYASGRVAARGTSAASTVSSSSYRSGTSNSSYHGPMRLPTSRSSTYSVYDWSFHDHDMGCSGAGYSSRNTSRTSEPGQTERLSLQHRSYSPHVSATSSNSLHGDPCDTYRPGAGSRLYSNSERNTTQAAPSSSEGFYRGELVPYRADYVPSSYHSNRGSYQQNTRILKSTYYEGDNDGGVSLQEYNDSSFSDDSS